MKKSFYLLVIIAMIYVACDSKSPMKNEDESDVIQATTLNLNFEQVDSNGNPLRWYIGGDGYSVTTDPSTAYSGKRSLCIKFLSSNNFGVATSTFPLEDAKGKKLKFIGYIKTKDITSEYAGLWMRVDGENREVLAFDNMYDRGVAGTRDWKKYEIELEVDQNATNINFGALLSGNGTAWFDAFAFEVDGQAYQPPLLFNINAAQLAWLKENIQPFDTEEPGSGFSDLTFLKDYIGSAHIVSLGEGTHGTCEFFKMKHRIIEFLANEIDFTIFAIEANMPECRAINEYVLYGEGNAREALKGIYFWTWNTQEVLDMIEWMRDFNASGKGKMQFLGFDMQFPDSAMKFVERFVAEIDPEFIDSVRASYDTIRTIVDDHRKSYRDSNINPDYESWKVKAQNILNHLIDHRDQYILAKDPMEVDWVIQDARVVLQAASLSLRDQSMADNVDWILEHSDPGTKIVLWAHNGHVNKKPGWMGSYLSAQHGTDMVVFGFCFHEGTYTAVGVEGLSTYGTSPSDIGSVEYAFHQIGYPRFMLDLRLASPDDPNSAWLTEPIDFRSIGSVALSYAFYQTHVSDNFDILIFFDQTHPSVLLNSSSRLLSLAGFGN